MATPIGQLEGKYEILEKIKEGGMGAVYKVRHRLLDEVRVIKLIRPQLESDEGIKARFLGEARKGVKLRHPHIAQFYDFSIDDDGNAFIVMEFVEGAPLDEILRKRGPLSIGLTLEIAEQSLSALGYLHKRGIVHRDISPDNLMVGKDDEGRPLVRLIDLGIAKVLAGESGLTQAGTFLGKVRYASPEQFRAQEGVPVDARSDLYSFGIVLYELLTGTHPIRGTSLSAMIAGHLFNPPLDFASSDPEGRVPGDLRAVVLRAMEKQPERRFQTAAAFAHELAKIKARFAVPHDELTVALEACLFRAEDTHKIRRPGSTQARLDREFGLAGTPTPPASEYPRTIPTAPLDRAAAAPAREEPRAPTEPDRAAAYQAEVERRSRAIVERLAAIDEAIDKGRFETAATSIDEAAATYGALEALEDLRRRLTERRAQEAGALLAEAEVLAQGSRFREALIKLEAAAKLAPEEPRVGALRGQVEQAQRAQEEAERRRRALAEESSRIAALLERGELDAASTRLEAAVASLGAGPELEALRQRLAAAREQARRAQVAALLEETRAQLAAGRFKQALAKAQQAGKLDPESPEVRAVAAEVHEAQRAREEAELRQRAASEEVRRIEKLLRAGDLDAAAARLEAATASFRAEPALAELTARLAEARERQRLARVASLLEQARTSADAADFVAATTALEDARHLAPEDERPERLLAEVRERAARHEAERQRAQAVAAVEGLIRAGQLTAAVAKLDAEAARLGNPEELLAQRRRIVALQQAERAEKAAVLAREARGLLAAGQPVEAEARVEQALALAPEDRGLRALLQEVHGAVAAAEAAAAQPPAPPPSAPPPPPSQAARRLEEDTLRFAIRRPVEAPAQPPAPRVAEVPRREAPAAPLRLPIPPRLALAAGAGLLVLAIAVIALVLHARARREAAQPALAQPAATAPAIATPGAAPATGLLVLDALPWAEVVRVEEERGGAVAVPPGSYTPLALPLPPGRYRATLRHPGSSAPTTVEGAVAAGQATRLVAEFKKASADEFLARVGW